MKTHELLPLLVVGLLFLGIHVNAQPDNSQTQQNQTAISQAQNAGNTKFLLTGYAFTGYEKEGEEQGTFGPAGFSPIFLWKKSDKLFFESELEVEIEDGELNFNLEYANLHYTFNKYLTVSAGKFLSPFGTFADRLHPAWINKFAEKPLGFSEEGAMIGPFNEFGAALQGGAQLGSSKINYVIYVSNGPSLIVDDPLMAGELSYDNLADNNNNKAIGGRLGFLPLSNSSLELGISGQTAIVGDEESEYSNVRANMLSGDISFQHQAGFLDVNVKGQLNRVMVDKSVYQDELGADLTFDNVSTAYYFQLALRPAFLNVRVIRNFELAGRYSAIRLPENALWGDDESQFAIGLNYWLNWNSVLKIDYQKVTVEDEESEGALFLQAAFGF